MAQSSAFTYQGRLKNGASPAAGLHDFRFKLFDAATGGTQMGTTQCIDNLLVSSGVFTATIDFGNQFITAGQRFIEIEVRTDTGLSCSNSTGFTTLTPRQAIAPTPTAVHANSAFALDAPDGSPANAVFFANNGNVGIGTTNPGTPLHIVSSSPVAAVHIASPVAVVNLQDTGANANQTGYVSYRNATGTETAWIGFGSAGDPDFTMLNARPGGDIVLNTLGGGNFAFAGGNVGIGTTNPASKLEVRGDVRLGPVRKFFAASGEENLRIVRGDINSDGSVLRGTGFTVLTGPVGSFNIKLTTPMAATPTVVATAGPHGMAWRPSGMSRAAHRARASSSLTWHSTMCPKTFRSALLPSARADWRPLAPGRPTPSPTADPRSMLASHPPPSGTLP